MLITQYIQNGSKRSDCAVVLLVAEGELGGLQGSKALGKGTAPCFMSASLCFPDPVPSLLERLQQKALARWIMSDTGRYDPSLPLSSLHTVFSFFQL